MTTLNAKTFYDEIRATQFKGHLGPKQFEGLDAILQEGLRRNLPANQLAYIMATPVIETDNTFQPIAEKGAKSYFNKYDIRYNPKKAKVLGNDQPGDGYLYRGRGHVQTTGRGNYTKFRDEVLEKFGVDIVANPDAILGNMALSVYLMFEGMLRGVYTGKKLSDYVNTSKTDFYNARRTVNGLDRAKEIAGIAQKFLNALNAAGYKQGQAVLDPLADGYLGLGDRGSAVEKFGQDMTYVGYGPLSGDVYDPTFVTATRKFQADKGLKVDGKAGTGETLPRLKAAVTDQDAVNAAKLKPAPIPVSTVGEDPDPRFDPEPLPYSVPEHEGMSNGKKGAIAAGILAATTAVVLAFESVRDWLTGLFN